MKLICKVVAIRHLGASEQGLWGVNEKAVDLLWRADDGSILRDDGATEIEDQINLPLDADDAAIEAEIAKKREALMEALAKPGVGITVEAAPMPPSAIIGREF